MKNFLNASKVIHWILCGMVASTASLSYFILSFPLCWGCLATQAFLWLRLILRDRTGILLCLVAMLSFQGIMLHSALSPQVTCPFDSQSLTASCHSSAASLFMGYPFVLWSFMGTFGLFAWSWTWKD